MTSNQTVTDLIAVTARLVDLMVREIESLRAMRPRDIEALQADKAMLLQVCVRREFRYEFQRDDQEGMRGQIGLDAVPRHRDQATDNGRNVGT